MHKSGCSYFVNRCLIRHYLTLTKGACLFVLPNSVQLEEHIIRGWWFKSRFCVWKLLSISDMSADLWQKKIWHVCAVWAEIQTCLNVDHVLSISEHREMHQNQSRGLHLQKNIQTQRLLFNSQNVGSPRQKRRFTVNKLHFSCVALHGKKENLQSFSFTHPFPLSGGFSSSSVEDRDIMPPNGRENDLEKILIEIFNQKIRF